MSQLEKMVPFRKMQILSLAEACFLYEAESEQWITSVQVADYCEIPVAHASELLRRYQVGGDLWRKVQRSFPLTYVYHISQKGLDKLGYWRDQGEEI